MRVLILIAIIASAAFPAHALAVQVPDEDKNLGETNQTKGEKPPLRLNLPFKTAGGTQLWTDCLWRDGYRVQKNSLTGHFRLVDAKDVRRAWGNRDQCEAALERLRPKSEAGKPKHVVVLLHGLVRTHRCMKPLEEKLRAEGYADVIRFAYASTRSSIDDHAAALRELLEDLPAETEFSFVGHSMGSIVLRRVIDDLKQDQDPKGILPRCQSMVMLGPPNQGAAIARRLASTGLYAIVMGKGGMELGPQWDSFVERLATPEFPFLIIAGDISANRFSNPLVDGSGDFVVGVEEAKLDGAESFETLPVLHSFLMRDEAAMKITVDFINKHQPADHD